MARCVGARLFSRAVDRVETERLLLERWRTVDHTAGLADMNADREVMRFVGAGRGASRAESEAQSRDLAAHWDRFGFGLWAVIEAAGARMAGFAGLSHPLWFPAEAEEVEVGWRLNRTAWGNGYATEAARAGIAAGFGDLGLDRLVSYIHPDNARSHAVARRLGMTMARETPHPSRPHTISVYELRREP